jgi:hypothetical protein
MWTASRPAGAPKAITAAAHRLARILFHMVTTREAYDESIFAQQETRHRNRLHRSLEKQAQLLGFQLVKIETA